ncbi:MAG: hypothetical protein JSR70_07615 [Proteobacteria bacterium]|nr:hypothetical protein [Pseudomonadota bacterium]
MEYTREALIAASAKKTSLVGSVAAVWGGLTATDIAAYGGLLIAVIGLCVNWYYRNLDNQRKQELHDAQLAGWRVQQEPDDGDGD